MRVPQSYIQKCKAVAHIFQISLAFIAGCLTLAIIAKDGETGGATKYYIALCSLTGPGILYLVMVPAWRRTKRFANAYAFLALDALYTIFWFAAFIAVAVWNSKGIREGAVAAGAGKNDGNCSTFKFGSETKCKLSKATVGFGVVVFILFGVTTVISGYYLIKYKRDGVLPYESNTMNPHHASGESAKDNAWSTEIETHDDDDDDDRHTEHGGNQQEDEYALLHSTETDEGRHPGRPLSWGDGPGGRDSYANPTASYGGMNDHASVLSSGGYEEYRREAGAELDHSLDHSYKGTTSASELEKPYGSSGHGYSFSGGDR